MNKNIFSILLLSIFVIFSCEESNDNDTLSSSISIESPYEGYEFIYNGNPLEIRTLITNLENASSAYIYVNGNVIASGLEQELNTYYEPNSNISQNILIEAKLFDNQSQIIASDSKSISINTLNSNTSDSDITFMNVDNQFQIMRTPVTNRQFLHFLNNNNHLNVEIVNVVWDNADNDTNGNPLDCEYDIDDSYEPTNWWYVTVKSNFANENIPSGEYAIYRNADNIYDSNANYSNQASKIQYDCESETFYLPNEADGTESIYLDHPVVGVSWIGANVFANFYGWTIPSMEQWEQAAKGTQSLTYPWQQDTLNQNYANYNNDTTTPVANYNGTGELNLSLSEYGLYDMAGNVWEYTNTSASNDSYYKTGGAYDSDAEQLQIGYQAFTLWEQVSGNTGFRCVANINHISPSVVGCTDENSCNYDMFATETSNECYTDDCLLICGGTTQEYEFFQDLDLDGLGNPEISEFQCNEPQDGWANNNDDLDDECFSINVEQSNIDCNNTCDGSAEIDGCGTCVGGTTGNEACASDCNGDEGGTASWDDCNVCSGGNTNHEPNSDKDCNGDCFGTASVDDCGVCSGGNTGLESNADIDDCGVCFGNGLINYCTDNDQNGCCDCGNNDNGDWQECSIENDTELLCESEVQEYHIENTFGCSISAAENYYCNSEDNDCFQLGNNTIPPCNFIDDGSCIVFGCSDQSADNYDPIATICSDGSINDCCEYTTPIELSFGSVDVNNGTLEILITVPEYENESDYIYGFQFNINGISITGASGGIAEDAGFTLSTGGSTVLGFSFSGDYIGQGQGILTNISFSSPSDTACIELGDGAFSNQSSQAIPVIFGDCFEF